MTSRVLEALRTLEGRQPQSAASAPRPEPRVEVPVAARASVAPRPAVVHQAPNLTLELAASVPAPRPVISATPPALPPEMAAAKRATRLAAEKMCLLPTAPLVANHYLDLARRVSEHLAASYCAVLAFVGCDELVESCFSIVELAQAFSLQATGNVLLVDGDLRRGRLSKLIGSTGPGMTEVMACTAHWPEIIHATTTPRVDFVNCGDAQVPTIDRPEFGWGALRPRYRAVLIGVGDCRDPETTWLAARCDAVYFVLSRSQTKRRSAVAAVEELRSRGANVLGCVVIED